MKLCDLHAASATRLALTTTSRVVKPANAFGYIYLITDHGNSKKYVGLHASSNELDGYCCSSLNKHLWNALEKRPHLFTREVVYWVTNGDNSKELLLIAERFFILAECSHTHVGGYNSNYGGFSSLGMKASPETKAKHSKDMQKRWQDPEVRKYLTEVTKPGHWDAQWQDPEQAEFLRRRLKEGHLTDKARSNHSNASKRHWEDHEARAVNTENIRRKMNEPEVRRATSERKKLEWQDPEIRDKAQKGMSEAWKQRRGYDYILCVEDNVQFSSLSKAGQAYGLNKFMIKISIEFNKPDFHTGKSFVLIKDGQRVKDPQNYLRF